MSLLNPIWLWGLSALTIPVAIHLLSRKEGKTIRIGSLRFLSETSTSKFSSIRLNEIVLLTLRSALVILIVLFLADLLISVKAKASRKWALVEQSLEHEPRIKTMLDSLQKDQFEIRRFAENFPKIHTQATTGIPDYYKLTELLGKENELQAIVLASNSHSGFKGRRNSLPKNVTWFAYPRSANKGSERTNLNQKSDTLRITLLYANDFLSDKKIMTAALKAIEDVAPRKISVTEVPVEHFKSDQNNDWLICLSNADVTTAHKILCFKEGTVENLIEQKSPTTWILTQHVTETNAVEQHLPVQLMEMLFGTEMKQEMITAYADRTIAQELAWTAADQSQSARLTTDFQSINKILLACIVFLFIAERILAFYRKQ